MSEKFSEIIKSDTPTLVDFFAEWCGPCKTMKPILEELKKEMGEQVKILKIDVDHNPQISQVFQIQSVPTLILFKSGNIVWRQSGVVMLPELKRVIETSSN
jgi:thioredoxin 1